ncbi:hypothetical protein Ga0074115_10659 [endosymbiont of Ridgeia piscesae]|uniref:Uncharacterized protein n=1 Tax=endosymbiont of Ridgeia piscesae TaxID=54398 RepID=A0A0T5Z1P3_9GAMM|nr:hypothetical protein Ga0074115_10659 [endosymbiont of Ridgeia piscesae]KRT56747.1 hypothetical protein Ga0076813_10205 [endosymbiont of Ridgeia piscesae]
MACNRFVALMFLEDCIHERSFSYGLLPSRGDQPVMEEELAGAGVTLTRQQQEIVLVASVP